MSLLAGARLGAYEIIDLVGAGGMGEVYRARDTRLGREIAIKVLPPLFSSDPERVRRFDQEARAAAALNHPNILAVHDVGADSGTTYVVSELLEGRTLRDVIADGPMPVGRAVDVAIQMARGLAAAHEKGIVHRDLKPENVFITHDERVKILDFGLAKLAQAPHAELPAADLSRSPTRGIDTTPGLVLGTIGYMSPEQVRGHAADHRTDIFSFGAILYEMLSGARAFTGDSAVETMSAILKDAPSELATADRPIPPALARIVDRCLAKTRTARLQSASDLAFALETFASSDVKARSADSSGPAVLDRGGRKDIRRARIVTRVAWMVGGALAGAALATVIFWNMQPSSSPIAPKRLAIAPPPGIRLVANSSVRPIISQDGDVVVFAGARGGDTPQLFRRSLRELEAQAIPGTVGATRAFFSPDGKWIAFVLGDKLQKVPADGGPMTLLAEQAAKIGVWGPDDSVVYGATINAGLTRLPTEGGTPTIATKLGVGEFDHRLPTVSKNERDVLFTAVTTAGLQIFGQSAVSGQRRMLVQGSSPLIVKTGHLLFVRGGSLWGVLFDPDTLMVQGTPIPVVENVATDSNGMGYFSVAGDGTLVYLPGTVVDSSSRVVYRTRDGVGAVPLVPDRLPLPRYVRVSPDGKWLAVTLGQGNQGDIWIYDMAGVRPPVKLTFEGNDVFPVWTRNSAAVVFPSDRTGERQLWFVAADGSATRPDPIKGLSGLAGIRPLDFMPDGALMVSVSRPKTGRDLFLINLDGTSGPREWLSTEFNEGEARVSPDGRSIAYVTDATGEFEVWVRPFPGPGAPVRVSSSGGREPVWSPDGKELYFQAGGAVMAVAVDTAPMLNTGVPERLFAGGFRPYDANMPASYDISSDGRFVMVEQGDSHDPPHIVVVTNWLEELKRLVPTK